MSMKLIPYYGGKLRTVKIIENCLKVGAVSEGGYGSIDATVASIFLELVQESEKCAGDSESPSI